MRGPGTGAAQAPLTQQAPDQALRGGEGVGQAEGRVAAALHLPQRLEVPEEDVAEPLGIHARDPPLPGLLVLQPARPFCGRTQEVWLRVQSHLRFQQKPVEATFSVSVTPGSPASPTPAGAVTSRPTETSSIQSRESLLAVSANVIGNVTAVLHSNSHHKTVSCHRRSPGPGCRPRRRGVGGRGGARGGGGVAGALTLCR